MWAAVSLIIAIALALGFGWWALTYHASTVGDYLPARAAWLVVKLGADGRHAATSSLIGAADYDLRIQDPAWRDLITRKLDGSPEDQVLMLNLLRNAFSYGGDELRRGIESPERERVFQLTSSPDRSVRLAARRCWRGNEHRIGEQAYWTTAGLAFSANPVPDSPISPDGWRPGRLGLAFFSNEMFDMVGSGKFRDSLRSRLYEFVETLDAKSLDRRGQLLLFEHLMLGSDSGNRELRNQELREILMPLLFSDPQWLDDIWDRDTTTALLLSRINFGYHSHHRREIRPYWERFVAGTIRWCLAQNPHRLPEWKANGQVVPAGDLERFGTWLIATYQVFGLHTWSAVDGLSPQTRAMAAPVTLPVLVEVVPDPERCSPFGLSLTMQRLWFECMDPHGPPRPEWTQWDIRTREWVELRQIMTFDHRAPDGTWPARGEVDAVWETVFMGMITDSAPFDD